MVSVLTAQNLCKSFSQGKEKIEVLRDINLDIREGEIIALMGESGRGKSTLLQILGGIMDFDSGEINILGNSLKGLSDNKKTELRANSLGFVYQYHHLLADFSALENVMLPQLMIGRSRNTAKIQALQLLERLGLADRLTHRPGELSGGQQQRVAIARALANNPKIVFADEPSGNLDSANSSAVMDLFLELAKAQKTTLVIATHSETISKRTDRVFTL